MKVSKLVTPLILSIMVLCGVLVRAPKNTSAQALNQPSNQLQNNQEDDRQEQPDSYRYVAQAGDSYSEMARKAVQTYGKKKNINLTQAQIIFAETNLTKEANSPYLNKGQTVEISEEAVKGWVDKAKELSAEKQSAWQKYTVGVDFNTDRVGQDS